MSRASCDSPNVLWGISASVQMTRYTAAACPPVLTTLVLPVDTGIFAILLNYVARGMKASGFFINME